MVKRWFAALIACMLLLTGCGGKDPSPSDDPPATPPAAESVTESAALAAFRAEIPDDSAQIAVAYLGYVHLTGYKDLTAYLETCGFYEMYPFLSELTEEQFIMQEGGDLYAVIPVSPDTAISVFDCYVDETDYVTVPGDALGHFDAGQIAVLQGNVSEIVPNLWVVAEKSGSKLLEYTPSLSMMDGKVAAISGVYDFSDYDHLTRLWQESGGESPVFCNTWYTQTPDGNGEPRALQLSL